MLYLYGNYWPRILLEVEGLPVHPKALLGDDVALAMTEEEFKAVSRKYDFEPSHYGLPEFPDTVIRQGTKSRR